MRYLPHTDDEITEMLRIIGKESVDDLFVGIPEEARLKGDLDIPAPMAEADLMRHLKKLGSKNQQPQMLSFLGAGCYAHHIPPAVDQLLLARWRDDAGHRVGSVCGPLPGFWIREGPLARGRRRRGELHG